MVDISDQGVVTADGVGLPELKAGMPTCCAEHHDWPTLAEHLLIDFPELTISEIVRELRDTRLAVDRLELPELEALRTGEALVRQRLNLRRATWTPHVDDA